MSEFIVSHLLKCGSIVNLWGLNSKLYGWLDWLAWATVDSQLMITVWVTLMDAKRLFGRDSSDIWGLCFQPEITAIYCNSLGTRLLRYKAGLSLLWPFYSKSVMNRCLMKSSKIVGALRNLIQILFSMGQGESVLLFVIPQRCHQQIWFLSCWM